VLCWDSNRLNDRRDRGAPAPPVTVSCALPAVPAYDATMVTTPGTNACTNPPTSTGRDEGLKEAHCGVATIGVVPLVTVAVSCVVLPTPTLTLPGEIPTE